VARSLSSGHLNLSQPTGSWASAGAAIAQADKAMTAALMPAVLMGFSLASDGLLTGKVLSCMA
jgi:hypothetical protein